MNFKGADGALRALENIEPIRRAETIVAMLAGLDAQTVRWLEHYLLTGNRAIDQAAAERVRNLARQCQATAPATEEVQP